MTQADIPSPDEPFGLDAFFGRWPTGAEKTELVRGDLLFAGRFDERDAVIARRAYPGRVVDVDEEALWVRPAARRTATDGAHHVDGLLGPAPPPRPPRVGALLVGGPGHAMCVRLPLPGA